MFCKRSLAFLMSLTQVQNGEAGLSRLAKDAASIVCRFGKARDRQCMLLLTRLLFIKCTQVVLMEPCSITWKFYKMRCDALMQIEHNVYIYDNNYYLLKYLSILLQRSSLFFQVLLCVYTIFYTIFCVSSFLCQYSVHLGTV